MKRFQVVFYATIYFAIQFCSLSLHGQETANQRIGSPNVLFILVDDFGPTDLSCYGSRLYETPNMDRLAKQGVRFTQAYVAYPRCVPSRFAIFTGKHPAPFQRDRDSVHVEPGRDVALGKPFQDAGYATFYCGKWHLGEGESSPGRVGFSTTVAAGAPGATRSHFAPYNQSRKGGKGEKHAIEGLDDAPEDEYLADRLTMETIEFIKENRERPFLAVLAHYAVHTPIEAKKHLTKRYAEKLDSMPTASEIYEPESAGENLLVQNNPTYAAMIESVDNGVGRLLKTLDRLDLAKNTIVVLASDHGGLSTRGNKRELATSNRPFRAGKGHLYEGGLRIPMIVRWPDKILSREIHSPVMTTDLFPTFLELAGLPLQPDAHVDGVSLASLLLKDQPMPARPFFWHNPAPRPTSTGDQFSSAIRVEDWKLLSFPVEERVELYNLQVDIEEANNLADTNIAKKDELLEMLNTWKKKVGASSKPRIRKKESR